MPQRIPACLASVGERTSTCDFPVSGDRKVVPYNDALADEISGLEGTVGPVSLVDPTPIACPDGVCPAMAGDIIVHRDDNHLSATFVRSRADEFAALLAEVGAEL